VTLRRLDAELVRRGLAVSRSEAGHLVTDGRVEVGGNPSPKPASRVGEDTSIRVVSPDPFVSRGGRKLEAALEAFGVDVAGRRAVDVGASTGGFTDCLLQRGATSVVAVDVGYGQIAERLRADERVEVVDRTNIRTADPATLGAPFDLVVVDVSFISLVTIADALSALGGPDTDWLVLVKPQFEVGRDDVGRGGIVRDPMLHRRAIDSVATGLAAAGLGPRGVVASPITGAKGGNREFLLHLVVGPPTLTDDVVVDVVGLPA
jgi:23S rRNA (cytidine1920-2'-O)/16S rRNA (cytidine1409-2'-O)-methyltransferase